MAEWWYRSGGFAPKALMHKKTPVAFWPEGVPPTQENIGIAVRLVQASEDEDLPLFLSPSDFKAEEDA